jgi:hypothetical protein
MLATIAAAPAAAAAAQGYFTIYELLRRVLGPESSLFRIMGAQGGEVVRNAVRDWAQCHCSDGPLEL